MSKPNYLNGIPRTSFVQGVNLHNTNEDLNHHYLASKREEAATHYADTVLPHEIEALRGNLQVVIDNLMTIGVTLENYKAPQELKGTEQAKKAKNVEKLCKSHGKNIKKVNQYILKLINQLDKI